MDLFINQDLETLVPFEHIDYDSNIPLNQLVPFEHIDYDSNIPLNQLVMYSILLYYYYFMISILDFVYKNSNCPFMGIYHWQIKLSSIDDLY